MLPTWPKGCFSLDAESLLRYVSPRQCLHKHSLQYYQHCSRATPQRNTYRALPIPIIHAVPGLQPLVPSPDCVMNEAGCVCFLSPNSIQKTTKNPETERKSVAWVILGTALGAMNNGPAEFVRVGAAKNPEWGRLACDTNCSEIYKIGLPTPGLKRI